MGRISGRGKAIQPMKGMRRYRFVLDGGIVGTSSASIALTGAASAGVLVVGTGGQNLLLLSTASGVIAVAGVANNAVVLSGASSGGVLLSGNSSVQIPIVPLGDADTLIVAVGDGQLVMVGAGDGGAPVTIGSSAAVISLAGTGAGATLISAGASNTIVKTGSATGQVIVSGYGNGVVPLLWFSNWSTAVGTSTDALRDGDATTRKWHVIGTACEVMPAGSVPGFPSGLNVLRVPWYVASGSLMFTFGDIFGPQLVPDLAIGATRYYRWYDRIVQPDSTTDAQTHPVQDGGAGSQTNWTHDIRNDQGPGVVRMGHLFWANPAHTDLFWYPTLVAKARTLRHELAVERVSATQFRVYSRKYDESISLTTPIITNADLVNDLGQSLESFYNAGNYHTINRPESFRTLVAGANDTGLIGEAGDYAYQAGFAISDSGWIGPYTSGGLTTLSLSGAASSSVLVSGAGANTLALAGSAQGFVRINADGTASIILTGAGGGQVINPAEIFGTSNVAVVLSASGNAVVLVGGAGSSPIRLDGNIEAFIGSEAFGYPNPLTIEFVRYDGNVEFERVDSNIIIVPVV